MRTDSFHRCENIIEHDGFCHLHINHVDRAITIDNHLILNAYCNNNYQKYFKKDKMFRQFLNLPTVTTLHINSAFISTMKQNLNNNILLRLVLHPKFCPDLCDYSIFLDLSIDYRNPKIQAAFSKYFYK